MLTIQVSDLVWFSLSSEILKFKGLLLMLLYKRYSIYTGSGN